MPTDRRSFMQMLVAGATAATFPESIARALAIPANNATGTIADVEHVVIMMQENRSFDHYFGMLKGVRGFGDRRAMKLPNGNSVFHQPVVADPTGKTNILPFHPTAPNLGLQFLQDLPHDWTSTHAAFNNGKYDNWIASKTSTAMAHLERADIPFHYALADAFTICDAYHCSLLGPTDPNRYYMWTGWVGNDGQGGGPVVDNAEAGYDWKTYPERLEKAGVSWKIYQDIGTGLDKAGSWGWGSDAYIGNYGDNSLLYFNQYRTAKPGTPLYDKARTGTDISAKGGLFDDFKADVMGGKLPAVSWVVAPEAYTEHPNWPANYGAFYVSQVLDALTANPEVWSKTVFLLTYDENDGFFDHMVPPTVPTSNKHGISQVDTVNELYAGSAENPAGPYGMGVRVPMVVISPWSKGGYVNSQLFDHTSMIRFLETRFGANNPALTEPNITPWRRAVAGDLTSCFNFARPNSSFGRYPSTAAYQPPDNKRHADYVPVPPAVQAMPVQEKGNRRAKALPYELDATAVPNAAAATMTLQLHNTGTAAAVFQVRSSDPTHGPWSYTVLPGASLTDTIAIPAVYAVSVYGPNGFFREFAGSALSVVPKVSASYTVHNQLVTLTVQNPTAKPLQMQMTDVYSGQTHLFTVPASGRSMPAAKACDAEGWYDVVLRMPGDPTFLYQAAGHVENGKDSYTDPAM